MNRDDALRKIRILLTITPERGATEGEASAAVRQARALMTRYEIEHADVLADELKDDHSITKQEVTIDFKSMERSVLAVAVARLFDCHVNYRTDTSECAVYSFYGYSTDVPVACWTYSYLIGTAERATHLYAENLSERLGQLTPETRNDRLSRGLAGYHRGFVRRLAERVRSHADEREATQGDRVKALVVRKDSAIENKFGSFAYSNATYVDPVDLEDHVQRGRIDAEHVRVDSRPVEQGPTSGSGALEATPPISASSSHSPSNSQRHIVTRNIASIGHRDSSISVRCGFCGADSRQPDFPVVICPRCRRTLIL